MNISTHIRYTYMEKTHFELSHVEVMLSQFVFCHVSCYLCWYLVCMCVLPFSFLFVLAIQIYTHTHMITKFNNIDIRRDTHRIKSLSDLLLYCAYKMSHKVCFALACVCVGYGIKTKEKQRKSNILLVLLCNIMYLWYEFETKIIQKKQRN